jgi:hypothetical protein
MRRATLKRLSRCFAEGACYRDRWPNVNAVPKLRNWGQVRFTGTGRATRPQA